MSSFQAEKAVVRAFHADLAGRDCGFSECLHRHCVSDLVWRGFHPFNVLIGFDQVVAEFWQPLANSLSHLQRREDIFFAGQNVLDDFQTTWVVSMGHLMGLFDVPWLNIPATGKMAFLRYCEFHRVEAGKIAETAMYFDIPHLMAQAGVPLFPPQTAVHLVQPGPQTHDGLLYEPQPAEQGRKTLALISRMSDLLGQWQSGLPLEEELRETWTEDMIWWGPEGIGATYTVPRYAQQHARPFRMGFTERSESRHLARLAEGHYGGFFGWPNFTATPTGGFMGMPATGKPGEFRVIDIYRRAGEKLAENWVFIDLLHFWKTQGVDILGRHQDLRHGSQWSH
ncbi:MAG: ester cyclase [Pseudomonadota bacterium]